LEKGKNFYTLIENKLREKGYPIKNRVSKSNPNVEMRCNFKDEIFRNGYEGIDISISKNCVKTISDYKYLKQASDGTKHKEKTRDPVTKVSYEKYGHNTDANEYFICEYFHKEFYKFQNPSENRKSTTKRRKTRKGY